MWLQFIKEMSMVQYLKNMHPRETMLNESELAISGMVTPTTQSNIHINSFWLQLLMSQNRFVLN